MAVQRTGHRRKPTVPLPGGRPFQGKPGLARSEAGQSTVEFVALLPLLALVALVMGQGVVAGYAAWSAAGAARIGARAQALGEDPLPSVRKELPIFLGRGPRLHVLRGRGDHAGEITVRVRIPSIVPGLRLGTVAGRAHLPDQAGA